MAAHPSRAKTSAGKILALLALFLPVLIMVYLPFFVVSTVIAPVERRMVTQLGGDIEQVDEKALATFDALFVQTQIVHYSRRLIGGEPNQPLLANKNVRMQHNVRADWINRFWSLVFKAVWRFYALSHMLLPVAICLCLPAVTDGALIGRRKLYQFQGASRVAHFFSVNFFALVLGLFMSIPFWPVDLDLWWIIGMMTCAALSCWFLASNSRSKR